MFRKMMLGVLLFTAAAAYSAEEAASPPTDKISGWGWLTMGRVERSEFYQDNYDVNFNREWLVDFDAGFKIVHTIRGDWRARFHLGMTTAYPLLDYTKLDAEFLRRKLALYMIDAAMENTYTFGNKTLYLEFGFMPVKYNPQSQNFGEYLFRSGTYPQSIYSGFELADKEKLTGIHLQFKNKYSEQGCFKADLYIPSDMRDFPIHDISPAILVSETPNRFIEVGAGIQFAHFIYLDERKTFPATDPKFSYRDRPMTPEFGYVGWVDTANDDTVEYTFRGIKSIARLTLNPQAFFQAGFLGKEDLKIYSEWAFLGWKNYNGWYSKPSERMPIMFGINLPSYQPIPFCVAPAVVAWGVNTGTVGERWKSAIPWGVGGLVFGAGLALLDYYLKIDTKPDVFAAEGEYYNYPYDNSEENVWRLRSPTPYNREDKMPNYDNKITPENPFGTWHERHNDDWKWSVYFSKKLMNCLRISGQVASDHSRRTQYMFGPPTSSKYTEIVPGTLQWYWIMRIMYYF